MSDLDDTAPTPRPMTEERLAALPPEVRRRVLMGMQFILDLNKLHLEGMELATHLLEGKTPGADVGMMLVDFERSLRIAANEMLKHPTRVVHADAARKGETRLDDRTWETRVRIKASEARKAREEAEREERFRASQTALAREAVDEPEPDAGPRP